MLKHYEREQIIWAATISANEKLFLLALNSFVDANGECYPGLERLASMTGFTERTCRTIRDKLIEKGLVATRRRCTDKGHRTSDLYKLDFTSISSLPENISTGDTSLPEIRASLPENDDRPTGKSRQNLPEGFSRELLSKNYPEEHTQTKSVGSSVPAFRPSDDIARFEAQFAPQGNPPWVVSRRGNVRQYDPGFKGHVVKYLSELSCNKGKVVNGYNATTWLNAANYTNKAEGQKRLDDACALWDDYQESLKKTTSTPAIPKALDTSSMSPEEYRAYIEQRRAELLQGGAA